MANQNDAYSFNHSMPKGFTLIELVIVVVIASMLAAFALPKFVNVEKDAERAVTQRDRSVAQTTSSVMQLIGKQSQTIDFEGNTYVLPNDYNYCLEYHVIGAFDSYGVKVSGVKVCVAN